MTDPANTEQRQRSGQGETSEPALDSDIVRLLVQAGDALSYEVRDRIISQRRAAVPTLAAIAQGRVGERVDPWGLEKARLHAVDLLRDMADPEAVEPLLGVLARTPATEPLHDVLVFTLSALGKPVLEPALALYTQSTDPGTRTAIGMITARLGVRDERIFSLLVEHLAHQPMAGALYLADYGDPRAIEHLHRAFDQYEIQNTDPATPHEANLFAIESALKRLGSDLTPEERRKYDEARAATRASLTPDTSARTRTEATRAARQAGKKQRVRSKKKRKQERTSRKKNR